MTPAAESLVRALAGHVARSSEVRLLVAMARAALLAEGLELDELPVEELGADRRRPKTGAERQAAYRAKRTQPSTPGDADQRHEVTEGDDARDVTGDAPSDGKSDAPRAETRSSHSLEIVEERESETRVREATVTGPVTRDVTASVTATVTGERYVNVTDPLPELLREAAAMVPVKDVDGAWAKFTGHYAGKWVHVQGAWQKWCVRERKHEETERERRRLDEQARGGPAPASEGPRAKEERAKRDADHREYVKKAVPAPAAALFAAVGGRGSKA